MIADRFVFLAGAMLAIIALVATGWILTVELTEDETIAGPGLIVMPASLGGPLELINHKGERVTEATFVGHLTLIYFGYSFCPDICPLSLQTMGIAMAELGDAPGIKGVFITVDPERDHVEHLAGYVPLFHERLVGLTGSTAEIDPVAKAFRVYFKHRKDIDPEAYPVDHSSYIYLMDHEWRLAAVFRHDATADEIKAAVHKLL
ncbi:MAG: SCO family protein [Pseudomonadota bacterium]